MKMCAHRGLALLVLALLLGVAACNKSQPDFEDVPPADELYAKGLEQLEGRRILGVYTWVSYGKAIETFQAIVDNYPYSEYEIEAQLKIADAYFDDERYEEALSYYRDFSDLHPQEPRVPYTILRSALCHYRQIKSINRDQTSTREALRFLEELSARYPFEPETREGEVILQQLRTRLAKNIIEIGDFYLRRTQYQSAATRYRSVVDEYPGLGLDAEALYKLALCYENMKRVDEALRLYHVVLENFRDDRHAAKAAERIAAAF
jgi:outer membrane protein assembly factor BamD